MLEVLGWVIIKDEVWICSSKWTREDFSFNVAWEKTRLKEKDFFG